MKNKSIVNRIFIMIFLSAIFVGLISTMLITNTMLREYYIMNESKNQIYVDRLKEDFEQNLVAIESTVTTVANSMEMVDFHNLAKEENALTDLEDQYRVYFESILTENISFSSSLYVYMNPQLDGDVHDVWLTLEPSGFVQRHEEVPLERYLNNDNMSWFYVPRDVGQSLWLKPYTNRYDQLVSSFIVPIFQEDTYIGMVGMYLSFDDLLEKMKENSIYAGDFFWIENEEGDVIHSTSHEELTEEMLKSYSVFTSKLHNNWTLTYSVPKKETNKVFNKLILRAVGISMSFALIILAISQFSKKRYRAIFATILEGIKSLEDGNYKNKLQVPVDDELGAIANALNNASEKISSLNQELEIMAFENHITGLCNRNKLLQHLNDTSETSTLFYLDLDNFKTINEILGHNKGDMILKETAEKLKELCDHQTHLFHTAGDEFAFIVDKDMSRDEIKTFAKEILSKFSTIHEKDDFSFISTCSIGIAQYPKDAENIDELSKYLDVALYEAKSTGKNTFVIFEKSLYKEILVTSTLESQFRAALQNDELEVYYQPKINIKTNKVLGMEALVRWNHPTKGILPPSAFLDFAKKTGDILPMGKQVMKKALLDTLLLTKTFDETFTVSINMSMHQLLDASVVEDIQKLLEDLEYPPQCLVLEITENIIQSDRMTTIKKLNRLKSLGIRITMDEFGTGHSSFNTLVDTPLNAIKIGRQFIGKISTEDNSLKLVKSTIDLAHNLDLKVIAVGVETSDVLNHLIHWGCDTVQGFYYSKAVPFKELERFIDDYNVVKT